MIEFPSLFISNNDYSAIFNRTASRMLNDISFKIKQNSLNEKEFSLFNFKLKSVVIV